MINWDEAVLKPNFGVFGEAVNYQPKEGDAFQACGIFDEAYHELDLAGGTGITTEVPVLGVRLCEFPQEPKQDDRYTVLRTSETFIVKEVRKDGHGHAKLMSNFVG